MESDTHMPTIHPVILPVPPPERLLKGRDKVAALRALARQALALSARYAGLRPGVLEKDANGAPLPSNGVHWSLSHKSACVAAVASLAPVGIDVERIKSVTEGLQQRIAGPMEWALAPQRDLATFFRYWTAKEAVLKAAGKGLVDLSRCRIARLVDRDHTLLDYGRRTWTVMHRWVGEDHLVAVTADDVHIVWHQRVE